MKSPRDVPPPGKPTRDQPPTELTPQDDQSRDQPPADDGPRDTAHHQPISASEPSDSWSDSAANQAPTESTSEGGRFAKVAFALQFIGSLTLVGIIVVLLVFAPEVLLGKHDLTTSEHELPHLAIETVDADHLRIDPDSSLARKLSTDVVTRRMVSTPLLMVPGTVAASLRPVGPDNAEQWQFDEVEALEAYFDWRRARIDEQFAIEQTQRVRDLLETQLRSRRTIVERLRRLVSAGTDTQADLQIAEAELMEAQIEGQQMIHEADSDLRRARQDLVVAARQISMLGLDVEMLDTVSSDIDIVIAEVPVESRDHVRLGQSCEARFVGIRDRVFPGTVQRISPTLSAERRSLRVLFYVDDPDDDLRPGMFATIGLGTDPRESMLVPSTSVIHIGRDDFVFVRATEDSSHWRLVQVKAGDHYAGTIEILEGLDDGLEIITEGAILLKPVATDILRKREGVSS